MFRVISRALFWTYPRGSWQYDLMCLAIILFIFLTPDHVFHQSDSSAASDMVKEVGSVQVKTELKSTSEHGSVSKSAPEDPVHIGNGTAP